MAVHADLERLEQTIGVKFEDRSLLDQALNHTSYVNERAQEGLSSNERLEFLGDAVLGVVVADWLFRRFPDYAEGDLTILRSAIVRETTLARWARELGLGEFLHLGRGEEQSGGRERSTLLARAFEALIGALFLDRSLPGVRRFLRPFLHSELPSSAASAVPVDAKSRLQQLSQVKYGAIPQYRVVEVGGPAHQPTFTSEVTLPDGQSFRGDGQSKQQAEQAAAVTAVGLLLGDE